MPVQVVVEVVAVVVVMVAVVEVQVVVVPVQVVVQAKICADARSVSYPPGAQVNRSSRRS